MKSFFNLFGKRDPLKDDAEALYQAILRKSRDPAFYGSGRFPDSYEGRIDVLTLHSAILNDRLLQLGDDGQKLMQGVFDAMVDDFDIALREEGLTDSGVKRRIKPMIKRYYKRLKDFDSFGRTGQGDKAESQNFAPEIDAYVKTFRQEMSGKTLNDIASRAFDFPEISAN